MFSVLDKIKIKSALGILFFLLCTCVFSVSAREYPDSSVWQGGHIKLDIGNTAYTLIRSGGKTQQYEIVANVNLLKRFYPTIEVGAGWSSDEAAGGFYKGAGGFGKVGIDVNPLKKNRNNNYALLVGIRVGVGMQHYSLSQVTLNDNYWDRHGTYRDYPNQFRADSWGEVVAGVQVKVAGPFFMGWYARVHFLFTSQTGDHQPYYIPGYGYHDGAIFSFNYYLGLRW